MNDHYGVTMAWSELLVEVFSRFPEVYVSMANKQIIFTFGRKDSKAIIA